MITWGVEESEPYGPCGRTPMSCESINGRYFRRFDPYFVAKERKKRCDSRRNHKFYPCNTEVDANGNFVSCVSATQGSRVRRGDDRSAPVSDRPMISDAERIQTSNQSVREQRSSPRRSAPARLVGPRRDDSASVRDVAVPGPQETGSIDSFRSANMNVRESAETSRELVPYSPTPSQRRRSTASAPQATPSAANTGVSNSRGSSSRGNNTSGRRSASRASQPSPRSVSRQPSPRSVSRQPSPTVQTPARPSATSNSRSSNRNTSSNKTTSSRKGSERGSSGKRSSSSKQKPGSVSPPTTRSRNAMRKRYIIAPYDPKVYNKFYVDASNDDVFSAIKFYLIGTDTIDHPLIENTISTIKRKLKISKRSVTYQDVQNLASTYEVCVFVWEFESMDWLSFGDVFTCATRVLLFRENGRYGYLLPNNGSEASVRRTNRTSRPPRRYANA